MSEQYEIVTRDFVERIATIMGPSSAAALALQNFKTRNDAGEPNLGFLQGRNSFLVGPIPPEINA